MKPELKAAEHIRKRFKERTDWALVQGSGINAFPEGTEAAATFRYSDIPGFPVSTVAGHKGELAFVKFKDSFIAVFKGRVHYYEGYSSWDTVFPMRLAKELGVRNAVLTNAAGSLDKDIAPGDLAVIRDTINFAQVNPFIGVIPEEGERFIDMGNALSPDLIDTAKTVFQKLGLPFKQGVYVYLTGPCYETKAEVRMLSGIGGSLVGMSTVPEIIFAKQAGIRTFALSLCTNFAAGMSGSSLSHEEVIETGRKAQGDLVRFFREFFDVLL